MNYALRFAETEGYQMGSILEYKGYYAKIDYDQSDNIFFGRVLGIDDSLNFHGGSVSELQEAFRNSIDNYLDYCEQRSKSPESRE